MPSSGGVMWVEARLEFLIWVHGWGHHEAPSILVHGLAGSEDLYQAM